MNLVQRLRRSAIAIYIAVEEIVADDVAEIMREAAKEIELGYKSCKEIMVQLEKQDAEIKELRGYLKDVRRVDFTGPQELYDELHRSSNSKKI